MDPPSCDTAVGHSLSCGLDQWPSSSALGYPLDHYHDHPGVFCCMSFLLKSLLCFPSFGARLCLLEGGVLSHTGRFSMWTLCLQPFFQPKLYGYHGYWFDCITFSCVCLITVPIQVNAFSVCVFVRVLLCNQVVTTTLLSNSNKVWNYHCRSLRWEPAEELERTVLWAAWERPWKNIMGRRAWPWGELSSYKRGRRRSILW